MKPDAVDLEVVASIAAARGHRSGGKGPCPVDLVGGDRHLPPRRGARSRRGAATAERDSREEIR
jgi:hypothetical protein